MELALITERLIKVEISEILLDRIVVFCVCTSYITRKLCNHSTNVCGVHVHIVQLVQVYIITLQT